MGEEGVGEGGGEGRWEEVMVPWREEEAMEEDREVLMDWVWVWGNHPHWLPRSFLPSHQPSNQKMRGRRVKINCKKLT